VIAVVQLGIGAFLALAYVVLVGPTLVEVWTDDSADVAFGQFFFTATAVVSAVVVGFSLLTGWQVWRSAGEDRLGPAARVLLILQAVAWGGAALVVAAGIFGRFDARPGALVVAVAIAVFSVVSAGWLAVRDRR
jgi:small-conductance mechanosensitive channel